MTDFHEPTFRARLEAVGIDIDDELRESNRFQHLVLTRWIADAVCSAMRHERLSPIERAHWAAAQLIGRMRPELRCTGSQMSQMAVQS